MPTRDDAWKLLCEFTESESLRKHMLAVEACVRAYARKQGADEDLWSVTALLHDFDYERWPNNEHSPDKEHPAEGAKILRERGYSEEIVRAILSHADYSGVARQSPLEHTLFACDEIAGFLTACSYVRPSKSILDLEVDSVKRRLKDKAFAKGVSRDDVRKGAEELGIPLEEHIGFCINAMRAASRRARPTRQHRRPSRWLVIRRKIFLRLFVAQSDERINASRAPRGNVTCQQRDSSQVESSRWRTTRDHTRLLQKANEPAHATARTQPPNRLPRR